MGKVEEDIEILEEFIKYFEAEATSIKYRRNISITVGEDDIQAIENLIARNEELEEENRTLREDYQTENQYYKEKIEEKIEELNDYDSKFCQRVLDHNEHTLTELIQNILQELLED